MFTVWVSGLDWGKFLAEAWGRYDATRPRLRLPSQAALLCPDPPKPPDRFSAVLTGRAGLLLLSVSFWFFTRIGWKALETDDWPGQQEKIPGQYRYHVLIPSCFATVLSKSWLNPIVKHLKVAQMEHQFPTCLLFVKAGFLSRKKRWQRVICASFFVTFSHLLSSYVSQMVGPGRLSCPYLTASEM